MSDRLMPIDPKQRTDIVVKAVFMDLLETIKQHEDSLREQHSEKALHSFRIAVRKTRSLLGQCKKVLPANRLSRFRREFSWLGDFTTGARDMDVYLLRIEGIQSGIRDPDSLKPFIEYLRKKRDREHERLYSSLRSARYEHLKQDWADCLQQPVPQSSSLELAQIPAGDYANRRIRAVYKRVTKEGKRITGRSPDEEVHELRKSCKKLRYMITFFRELYPDKKVTRQIKQLRKLQNELGTFQDLCVQEAILQDFIVALDKDIWATLEARRTMDKLLGKIQKQKKKMHKSIPDVFARYACKKNHDECRKLFKG